MAALSAASLGVGGEPYQLQRRIGITIYFGFTFIAQRLLTWCLSRGARVMKTGQWQLGLCAVLLGIGLLTLVLGQATDNFGNYEDAFEWVLALLLQSYYLLI